VGVGLLKIEESESEVLKIEELELESELLCTDSTALITTQFCSHDLFFVKNIHSSDKHLLSIIVVKALLASVIATYDKDVSLR
jgi:hypothetical protein